MGDGKNALSEVAEAVLKAGFDASADDPVQGSTLELLQFFPRCKGHSHDARQAGEVGRQHRTTWQYRCNNILLLPVVFDEEVLQLWVFLQGFSLQARVRLAQCRQVGSSEVV